MAELPPTSAIDEQTDSGLADAVLRLQAENALRKESADNRAKKGIFLTSMSHELP
ncbi:MAG: hypothetical protein P1U65_17015 [Minwuia sp.]|nr:hypothetical protein [Minwuia sp.]